MYSYTGTAYISGFEYGIYKTKNQGYGGVWYYYDVFTANKIYTPEGYIDYLNSNIVSNGVRYNYYRKDHLGNIHEVWNGVRKNYYNQVKEAASTRQRTQYYPSGLPWAENFGAAVQKNKFNGCEFIEMHGFDVTDLGNRGVQNATNRFTSLDRFCEKFPWQSPYVHAGNNPVNYMDVNGDSVRVYTETEKFGHTWISVGEGDNMIVYSYGRYNGTDKGPDGSSNSAANGPGVLLRLTGKDALNYNEEKKSETTVSVFVVKDVKDDKVAKVLDDKFNSSQKLPDNPDSKYYNNSSAHVIDQYELTKNNCTTVVSDALNTAGSKSLQSIVIQQASSFGTWTSYTATNRFILPLSLQNYLSSKSTSGKTVYQSK